MISHLITILEKFERAYEGKYTKIAGLQDLEFWISPDNSAVMSREMPKYKGVGAVEWRLGYWNSRYFVQVSHDAYHFFGWAVDENFPGVFMYSGAALLGRDYSSLQKFSQICTNENNNLQIASEQKDGCEFQVLSVKRKTFSDVKFFFAENQLKYFQVDMTVGKLFSNGHNIPFKPWESPADSGISSLTFVNGPFEYEDGIQVAVARNLNITRFDSAPTDRSEVGKYEIIESRPLDVSISADRIDIEKFGIPERVEISVGSGVPNELRNGRLMKLTDAHALEIIHSTGFRPPSLFARLRYAVLTLVLIVLLGLFFYFRK